MKKKSENALQSYILTFKNKNKHIRKQENVDKTNEKIVNFSAISIILCGRES